VSLLRSKRRVFPLIYTLHRTRSPPLSQLTTFYTIIISTSAGFPKRLDIPSTFADGTCLSCCPPPELPIAFSDRSESNCSCRNPEKERLGAVYALTIGSQPSSESVPPSQFPNTPIDPWETLEQLDKKAKRRMKGRASASVLSACQRLTDLTMAQILLRQGNYAHDEEALKELASLRPPKGEPFSPENMRSVVDKALASKSLADSRSAVDTEASSAQTTKPVSSPFGGFTQYRMELVANRIENHPETGTFASYQTELSRVLEMQDGGHMKRRKAMAAAKTYIDPAEM